MRVAISSAYIGTVNVNAANVRLQTSLPFDGDSSFATSRSELGLIEPRHRAVYG